MLPQIFGANEQKAEAMVVKRAEAREGVRERHDRGGRDLVQNPEQRDVVADVREQTGVAEMEFVQTVEQHGQLVGEY